MVILILATCSTTFVFMSMLKTQCLEPKIGPTHRVYPHRVYPHRAYPHRVYPTLSIPKYEYTQPLSIPNLGIPNHEYTQPLSIPKFEYTQRWVYPNLSIPSPEYTQTNTQFGNTQYCIFENIVFLVLLSTQTNIQWSIPSNQLHLWKHGFPCFTIFWLQQYNSVEYTQ